MPKYRGYTNHHIVPSSMNGTNDKQNIKQLKRRTHEKLHILFSNRTPREQQAMMYAINGKALANDICDAIEYMLDKDEGYWYKDGVRVPKDKEIILPNEDEK